MRAWLLYAGAVIVAIVAITWPFFMHRDEFLFVRYFDANTIFNPGWMLRMLVSPWTYELHLGSTHARDLSYLSVQELLSAVMAPLGPDVRNRLSLAATAVLIFGGFLSYARVAFPALSPLMCVVAAFFYASNGFVVAFIHDGYSGLLVDYALLPIALVVIGWARRTDRPVAISFVPLLFLLTGMYNLTSVIVALAGVLVFEYAYIARVLRTSKAARSATLWVLAINVFWFVPLLYDLSLHPKQPILAESQGDIGVLTQYGGLSNTVLLRSFPSIWTHANNARECTGCAYYESPHYMIAMLFIAAIAVWGLLKAGQTRLLIALGASALIATGFRYEDELTGLPYQILMNLPTFDAFRSSVKFSALTAMLYSAGMLFAAQRFRTWRPLALTALAALVVALPYIDGAIIERNAEKHFPNFLTPVPADYARLRERQDLFSENAATLLLPKMGLAAYDFGAYGNDFLPPLLGKPTVSVSYLPQPNVRLDGLLKVLSSSSGGLLAAPLLRAMGIGTVLVHNDVATAGRFDPRGFGSDVADFGRIRVLKPPSPPLPRYAQASGTVAVVGDTGITLYGGMQNVAAVAAAPFDFARFCSGQAAIVLAQFVQRKTRAQGAIDIPCARTADMTMLTTGATASPVAMSGMHVSSVRQGAEGSYRKTTATVTLRPGRIAFAVTFRNPRDRVLYVIFAPLGAPAAGTIVPAATQPYGRIGTVYMPSPAAHIAIFNENFDPSWQGYIRVNGRWIAQNNFTINYFANAWPVPANTPLVIVNTLTILTLFCAAIGLICAVIYVAVVIRAFRPAAPP